MENHNLNNENNSQIQRPSEKTIKILLVDHDMTCLIDIGALMERCGYEVVTARQTDHALCALRTKNMNFNLVVAEINMSGMDGLKLQRLVHREFKLPVVLLSADDKAKDVWKQSDDGAVSLILKPVSIEDVNKFWVHVEQWKKKIEMPKFTKGQTSITRKNKVWTTDLHSKFLRSMKHVGAKGSIGKNIWEIMNEPGLTREQVNNHLQKFRISQKKLLKATGQVQHTATKELVLRPIPTKEPLVGAGFSQSSMCMTGVAGLQQVPCAIGYNNASVGHGRSKLPNHSGFRPNSLCMTGVLGAKDIQMNAHHQPANLLASGQTNNNGFFEHKFRPENYYTGIGQPIGSRNNPKTAENISYPIMNGAHIQSIDQQNNDDVPSISYDEMSLDELLAFCVENPLDED